MQCTCNTRVIALNFEVKKTSQQGLNIITIMSSWVECFQNSFMTSLWLVPFLSVHWNTEAHLEDSQKFVKQKKKSLRGCVHTEQQQIWCLPTYLIHCQHDFASTFHSISKRLKCLHVGTYKGIKSRNKWYTRYIHMLLLQEWKNNYSQFSKIVAAKESNNAIYTIK